MLQNFYIFTEAGHSHTESALLCGRLAGRISRDEKKKFQQLLSKQFFEHLRNIIINTNVFHYFENSKGIFFEVKILKDWLEIKLQNFQQVDRGCHLSALGCDFHDILYIYKNMNE